jgi:hypothetical protein
MEGYLDVAMRGRVTVEKIDKIYFCIECRMVFLFKSDAAADYETMSGHKKMREFPL